MKSGRNGFDILFGKHSWEVLVDENARALFDEAMSTWTRFHATEIVRAYDFSQFRQLVDIGGNRGVLLTTLLNVNPGLKGVVFDRVEVAEEARLWIASAGLTDRCSFVVGDFFGSVPQSDGYVVKHVLHDWSDERALQVLRNVRASIEPNGRLLVIEGVLEKANHDDRAIRWLDMARFPIGDRERTEGEFRRLFSEAGFELATVLHTLIPDVCLIEGRPR